MSDTPPPTEPPLIDQATPAKPARPGRFGRIRDRLVRFERWDRRISAILVAVAAAFLVYLVIAGWWVGVIDDDPAFTPPSPVAGGRLSVDMAEALIEREVDTHRWTANDPFFLPGALLDNMPHYQQGIVYAVARFTQELGDRIGRARGASAIDPDLDRAAGLLRNPGNVWLFDLSVSWAPTTPSDDQYRAAAAAIRAYNTRIAGGQAAFEVRVDNLRETLDRIAADLGSQSAALADRIDNRAWPVDSVADDVFYTTKGRLYGYLMILGALGEDFAPVIDQANARTVWTDMLTSLRDAVALAPWIVSNGAPDSTLRPNHLAAQGFYLLRARTQIREISSILQD
jgi:hypothetical protein